MRAVLLALAVSLAACGPTTEGATAPPAAAQKLEPFDLHIEIGRYGSMVSTVGRLTDETASPQEPEVTDPREMARQLRENVWEYNLVRSQLCARGLYTQVSCGPSYNPVWLADPAEAEVGLEEIQQRNEAFGEDAMRLWDTVCDDVRSRTPEDEKMAVCPME